MRNFIYYFERVRKWPMAERRTEKRELRKMCGTNESGSRSENITRQRILHHAKQDRQ
jgi:hypothetical protein